VVLVPGLTRKSQLRELEGDEGVAERENEGSGVFGGAYELYVVSMDVSMEMSLLAVDERRERQRLTEPRRDRSGVLEGGEDGGDMDGNVGPLGDKTEGEIGRGGTSVGDGTSPG
jgi:hypothetical protein